MEEKSRILTSKMTGSEAAKVHDYYSKWRLGKLSKVLTSSNLSKVTGSSNLLGISRCHLKLVSNCAVGTVRCLLTMSSVIFALLCLSQVDNHRDAITTRQRQRHFQHFILPHEQLKFSNFSRHPKANCADDSLLCICFLCFSPRRHVISVQLHIAIQPDQCRTIR